MRATTGSSTRTALLSLHFTLPFASPVLEEAKGLTISVYDPTYFIAFELAKTNPAKLSEGAPKGCAAKIGGPAQKPGKGAPLEGCRPSSAPMGSASPRPSWWNATGPDRTLLPISLLPAKDYPNNNRYVLVVRRGLIV